MPEGQPVHVDEALDALSSALATGPEAYDIIPGMIPYMRGEATIPWVMWITRSFLARKLPIVVVSLALSLLCCELLLRLFWPQPTGPIQFAYDPVRGGIPVPSQRGRITLPGNYDYTFSNNSLGLRGREIGPKRGVRILLLGDSFTYGIGVSDDETFAVQLERLTGREVINAGNPGTGTDYALRFYETGGHTLTPDFVALCFFPNDFQDNERSTYYDDNLSPRDLSQSVYAHKEFLQNPLCNWLLSHSNLVNLVKQNVVRTGLWQVSGPVNETHINAELTRRYLTALEHRVKASGAELIVFYLPIVKDVEEYRAGKESATERALQSIQIETSLTPTLANSKYRLDELYYAEGHWKPAAHELIAQAMAQGLAARR